LDQKTKELLDKWRKLDEKTKKAIAKSYVEYFIKLAKENSLHAWAIFTSWLASNEGMIIWPWLWKPEYRDIMIEIAYYYLLIISKIK